MDRFDCVSLPEMLNVQELRRWPLPSGPCSIRETLGVSLDERGCFGSNALLGLRFFSAD